MHKEQQLTASLLTVAEHCSLSVPAGVPVLADQAFLQAYSLLTTDTAFAQAAGEDELSAMFRVARLPADAIWRTRTALQQLQGEMNSRCVRLLVEWLKARGLCPDAGSAVVTQGL